MTCTSPTLRQVSRIYQDLKSIHFRGISSPGSSKQFESSTGAMASQTQVGESAIPEYIRVGIQKRLTRGP